MKTLKVLFVLCCVALLCSSCFEILEEINLKPDGSGNMTLTLNLSQSKTKVASVMLMDSINGYKVPSKQSIQKELAKAVADLKTMPGISNVKSSADFNNYITSISFDFSSLANVNNISKKLLEGQRIKANNIAAYAYHKDAKSFVKSYQYNTVAKSEFNKLKQADKNVFQNATYTSIYRFPQMIKSNTNAKAQVSKSQKAVMHKVAILDIINGKANLANTVNLQ